MLVGCNSFVGIKMLSRTSLNECFKVKTLFSRVMVRVRMTIQVKHSVGMVKVLGNALCQ